MKLYCYAVKENYRENKYDRVLVVIEVKETQQMYKSIGKDEIPFMYSSQINKALVGKALSPRSWGYEIAVYLTERDDAKAIELLTEEAKRGIQKVIAQLEKHNKILECASAPLREENND